MLINTIGNLKKKRFIKLA